MYANAGPSDEKIAFLDFSNLRSTFFSTCRLPLIICPRWPLSSTKLTVCPFMVQGDTSGHHRGKLEGITESYLNDSNSQVSLSPSRLSFTQVYHTRIFRRYAPLILSPAGGTWCLRHMLGASGPYLRPSDKHIIFTYKYLHGSF